jgi:hypothetical protein
MAAEGVDHIGVEAFERLEDADAGGEAGEGARRAEIKTRAATMAARK